MEVDWRNTRPPPNGFKRSSTGETTRSIPSGFKRSSTLETAGTTSAQTSLSSSSSSPAASRIATPSKSVRLKKKSVPYAPPSSSLFKHTPSTWFGGKDKVVEEDWRNARIPLNSVKQSHRVSHGRTRMETPAVESGGRFRLISQRPAKGNVNVRRDRPPIGRSLSRGRTWTETPDAADKKQSVQSRSRSRSKNRQGRRDRPSSDISGNDSPVSLEYDSDSAKTARVNNDLKLSRTEKVTHSMRGHISSSQHNTSETSCLSRSRTREARGSSPEARARSRSSHRDKDKSLSVKIRSLSRGSCSKSSQLIVRQETNLRVSDMPFNDQNNGDGYYTGDINDYGQPMGHGTLRYDDGTVFKGWWKDGYSEEMDASAALKACGDKKIHRFY